MHYLRMDGKETFKNAVQGMLNPATECLRRCEIDISQINASSRIRPTCES